MAEVEATVQGQQWRVTIPDTVRSDAERNQAIVDELNAGRGQAVMTMGQRVNQAFGSENRPLRQTLGGGGNEMLRGVVEPMVAPTIGTAVGTALGTPAGPVGMAAGAGLGSLAGEGFNQMTGISEPSLTQLALAFGLPAGIAGLVAPYGGQAVRAGVARSRPGREAIQEEAFRASDKLPAGLLPNTPSSTLYAQLQQFNPQIPMLNTASAARDLQKGEETIRRFFNGQATMLEREQLATLGQQLEAATLTGPKNFADVWPVLQRIGKEVGDRSAQGGVEHGAMKHLYAAFHRDMEAAGNAVGANAALPAVQTLRGAVHAYKRESAAKDLAEQIYKGKSQQGGSGVGTTLNQFNAKPALQWIDDPANESAVLFRKSVTTQELAAIRETLQRMNAYPKLRAPVGTITGSSLALGRAGMGALLGKAAGDAMGLGGVGQAMTAAAGIKGMDILYGAASRTIATALMSQTGRRWLTTIGPNFHHSSLALLASAARAGVFEPAGPLPRDFGGAVRVNPQEALR